MGRGLSAQEFIAYAKEQVVGISIMLGRHRPTGPSCTCGRPLPCPVEETLRDCQEHFSASIALAEKTAQLPVVVPQSAGVASQIRLRRVRPRWRALLTAVRRAT